MYEINSYPINRWCFFYSNKWQQKIIKLKIIFQTEFVGNSLHICFMVHKNSKDINLESFAQKNLRNENKP
ncbi:hypothetical protein MtrunA17_Chr1g0180821 [Medicago truncatula]|uniref:Uncharacterized protein n=1 Tax=Medicago truncatula TaxID=3880 RepID=A0A396JN97_MEDTR|nr:hypothetical protein MtrunA17_Chr1g0180821 [Medicago truncatula]